MIKNGYELSIVSARIVIRKADLDTCLTAHILGVREGNEVFVAPGGAAPGELADPEILCIEAGGSGTPQLGNFDHHDPQRHLKPACRQAYDHLHLDNAKLSRLVDYVCLVDEDPSGHPPVPFPSLSNIFSGMMLIEKDPLRRFWKGVGLLREILALMPCVTTFEALYLASEDARLPTVMPYGKHKGVPIAQVPMDYRAWLLKQPDVDEYLIAALAAKTNKEAA